MQSNDVLAWIRHEKKDEFNRTDEVYNHALSVVEMHIEKAEPVAPIDGVTQGRHISGGCKDYTVGNQTFAVWDENGDLIQLSERQAKAMANALAEPVAEDRTAADFSLSKYTVGRDYLPKKIKLFEDKYGISSAAMMVAYEAKITNPNNLDFDEWSFLYDQQQYEAAQSAAPELKDALAQIEELDRELPRCEGETLIGAVRNLKQAALMGEENCVTLEARLAKFEPVPSPAQPAKEINQKEWGLADEEYQRDYKPENAELNELRQLVLRISTDCAQTQLEDPIRAADNWVMLSTPVSEDIGRIGRRIAETYKAIDPHRREL